MRLEKQFTVYVDDKPYHLQLLGEVFNLANHQNVTGVNSSAYNLVGQLGLGEWLHGSARAWTGAAGMLDCLSFR